MKSIVSRILGNKFLTGSFILLVAFNLFNALNFLFQFSMARMLSISEYGVLASLFSIIYMLGLFMESIQTVITKYSSKEHSDGKLKALFNKAFKKSLKFAILAFGIYLLIAIPLAHLLKISYPLVALTGLCIFVVFTIPIPRGIMQGTKRFSALGINMTLEAVIKLSFAIGLVYLGLGVYGALIATIFAVIVAFVFSIFSLRKILNVKEEKISEKELYQHATPTAFIIFTIMIFYSIDVIMAKILFTDQVAGSYAVASVLAKIIFLGTHPISRAMFPISANNKNENKNSDRVFLQAIGALFFVIIVLLLGFYIFPDFIISIFSGKQIYDAARILCLVGVSMGIISVTNLVLLYKLSIGQTKGYIVLPAFIILEILLLTYFSHSLFQFSIAFITASAAFLFGSIVIVGKK